MEPFFPIFNPENNGKVSTEKEVFSRESADEGISCSDLRVAFINEGRIILLCTGKKYKLRQILFAARVENSVFAKI